MKNPGRPVGLVNPKISYPGDLWLTTRVQPKTRKVMRSEVGVADVKCEKQKGLLDLIPETWVAPFLMRAAWVLLLSMLEYHVEFFHISLDLQNVLPDCVGIFCRVWMQD